MLVTIEDEKGDAQLIFLPHVFARCRRELGSRVLLAWGLVSRRDATANVVVSVFNRIDTRVLMIVAHD